MDITKRVKIYRFFGSPSRRGLIPEMFLALRDECRPPARQMTAASRQRGDEILMAQGREGRASLEPTLRLLFTWGKFAPPRPLIWNDEVKRREEKLGVPTWDPLKMGQQNGAEYSKWISSSGKHPPSPISHRWHGYGLLSKLFREEVCVDFAKDAPTAENLWHMADLFLKQSFLFLLKLLNSLYRNLHSTSKISA